MHDIEVANKECAFSPLQHTICTLSIKVGPDCFSRCAFANIELSQLNALFLQLLNIEQLYVETSILHKRSSHGVEKYGHQELALWLDSCFLFLSLKEGDSSNE